jgi:PAS domain S-box-containing protein
MIQQVLDLSGYTFSVYAIPGFAATAILLLFGLLVLIHERASRVSRLYALVTLTASVWLFAFSWMYSSTNEGVALWWAKAAYLGVPSIASAIYHFTAVALQIYPRCKRLVWVGWTLSALFTVAIVGADALFTGMHRYWWGYYPQYGWLSIPYLTFFFSMMVASLRNYWIEHNVSPPGTRKRRIKIFMVAFVFAYVATIDYAAKFGVAIYPFGYLPVLGWLGLVAVAIWRHQFVDITPAFAAEQITNTMADALVVFDREGMVRVVNRAACELFGRSEAELVGKPRSMISDDFFPKKKMEQLLETGSIRTYEVSYPVGQGRLLALELSTSVIRDRAGEPIAVLCIARNITERKQAEEAIRANEERFRSVAESANDAIVSADAEGRIIYWNRGAQTIFGYEEKEVLGEPLTRLMSERYRDGHRKGLERVRTTGEAHVIGKTVELHGLRKDGTEFPLELSLATWKMGEDTYYSGILRDITERKHLEEQLRQSQKMDAVGQLAGGIAHDFNNLLTVISGYSELLLRRLPSDHPGRPAVEQISQAGKRAVALTSQLLAFSRKQVLQPTVLDLNATVRNLEPMLRRLIGEHIELRVKLPPDVGEVKADSGQIEQVIMNLVVNARDAMPNGGWLTVETANASVDHGSSIPTVEARPGEYVMLSVSDTGVGMDAVTRSRIFEPFFTTKENGKGTGLGLSTVYGIVEQSDGFISADSEPGRGTTFRVYLPQVRERLSVAPPSHVPVEIHRGSETVLVVEDEEIVRTFASTELRSVGYSVLEAQSAQEATRICQEHRGPIHLLLTDVVMPGLNGRELAERLALLRPDMRILYMSGHTDDAVFRHGLLDRSVAFLQKPFSLESLARKVRDTLSNQS